MSSRILTALKNLDSGSMGDVRAQLAHAQAVREYLSTRTDGWANPVTGFGTSRDKTTYTSFAGYGLLDDWTLSDLYHGDDMAARMVDVVPDEMLREGFFVNVDDDKQVNEWLAERLRDLEANENLGDSWRWGSLFGGCGLVIGADDGRPASLPLLPERAPTVSYLYPIDRRMLWPLSFYSEPGHPKLGQPETYIAAPPNSPTAPLQVLHETRLIRFGGSKTAAREKQLLQGWDYSVLQRAHAVLGEFNLSWRAVSLMLTDGNQGVFTMAGLAEAIESGAEAALQARLKVIDFYRSSLRAIVVDAGDGPNGSSPAEKFERLTPSLEQLPQVLDRVALRLASTVHMPATILMGQSPAGMNATGESDYRWWYDRLSSNQRLKLSPRIRRLVLVLLAAKDSPFRGRVPKKLEITFPPLWRENPKELAERRSALATADTAYINAGVYLPQEVALARSAEGGLDREIPLTDETKRAREQALKDDLGGAEGDSGTGTGAGIELAPTDLAKIVTVNEARKVKGLDPVPNGDLTIEAYNALQTTAASAIGEDQPNTAAKVEGAKEVEKPPPPAPFGGGKPPFNQGSPDDSPEPPPSDEPGKPASPVPAPGTDPTDDDDQE